RFPGGSSRLARVKVASNAARARRSARLMEPGVGWRSSCAPTDWDANGPASGLFADWRAACSNCAISVLQGPACADGTPRPKMAAATTAAVGCRFMRMRPPNRSSCGSSFSHSLALPRHGACRLLRQDELPQDECGRPVGRPRSHRVRPAQLVTGVTGALDLLQDLIEVVALGGL